MSEKAPSDEILLNLMKAGDLDSFNTLFERYWEKLFTTVFSICPDTEVYRYVKSTKKKTIEYREELDFGNLVAVNDGESNIRYRELEKKVEEELEELPSRCKEIFTLS
eukprot:gene11882-14527_t